MFQYKALSPREDPEYAPEEWYHKGHLVLDKDNRPVILFSNIPDVLSSAFPAYAIEAILRTDSRIRISDILARMPSTVLRKVGTEGTVSANTISVRTNRFREEAGCLAWNERRGSKNMEELMERLLPPELKAANTTLGFRDLTPAETNGLKETRKVAATATAAPTAAPAAAVAEEDYDHDAEETIGDADAEGEADANEQGDEYDAARCLPYFLGT